MRFADLDAVTVDAFGTLLSLADPVPRLTAALRKHGVERTPAAVAAAFAAEGEYYFAHSHEARDDSSLAALRLACTNVFLDAAGADLDRDAFCPVYIDSLEFEVVPGARETIDALAARGLALAVVANWDPSLRDELARHGLSRRFACVVVSAEIGEPKPHPRPFETALAELGVDPSRAVHVGDAEADRQGAAAAGLAFAPAPLATAFAGCE